MTCWLCRFETTELATDPKAPLCRNGPCQACIDVAKVDEEINQAVATLQHLLAKRCDLRSEQNRVHDNLILRLPVELKNYIFELLLPPRNEWEEISLSKVLMQFYPTTISVCRGWRDIAWSNPSLWSTINIRVGPQFSKSDLHSRINFVRNWILRSRSMPLTLHIVAHEKEGFEEELKVIIDSISQSSNRWHSLSLDIPLKMMPTFQHGNFQCHLLKKLRIYTRKELGDVNQPPVPFLNSEVSPEDIEISGISFQSLQISWNHLSSAKVKYFTLEDITQLFQHASQMTCCHILSVRPGARNFSMPPIRHQRLKTLRLCSGVGAQLLGSLTLPCLQEFHTNEMVSLHPASLPALVQRSSCPLTRITLLQVLGSDLGISDDLQPMPGVTDLVLEYLDGQHVLLKKLLLEEYLPDLCRLTFRLQPFLYMWKFGNVPMLLDRKWLCPDIGRHRQILVIDRRRADDFSFFVWESVIGTKLKSLQLSINPREDGFEITIPEA